MEEALVSATKEGEDALQLTVQKEGEWVCYAKGRVYSFSKCSLNGYFVSLKGYTSSTAAVVQPRGA